MAIYHCTTKPISRSTGRSATASSAYRSAQKIIDKKTGVIHDYTKKQGVIYTEIISPKNINIDEVSREDLWNMAEQSEKRKDARVAREFVIALPHEISQKRQIEVAKAFSQYLSYRYEVVADLAIHEPSKEGDDKNVHAHIMITTRKIAVDKKSRAVSLTEKSILELSNSKRKTLGLNTTQDDIKEIRKKWADIANSALKKEGFKVRIDHRSYENQEKEQIPTKHEGVTVTELRRKGKIIGVAKLNEEIKEENKIIKSIKIEEQENHKPSFLERIGIRKIEKIEEDLPPIREVIKNIDIAILEADTIRIQAMYEKLQIENKIRDERLFRERLENQKRRAEKRAKQDPLEREYKYAVYGNSNHDITDFKELLVMNRFIAEVKARGNKDQLLRALKPKSDLSAKDRIETIRMAKFDQDEFQSQDIACDEDLLMKEELKRGISEVKNQFQTREKYSQIHVKTKDNSWDMDR